MKCFMSHVSWQDIYPPMCLCDGEVRLYYLPWGNGNTVETIAMCEAHFRLTKIKSNV